MSDTNKGNMTATWNIIAIGLFLWTSNTVSADVANMAPADGNNAALLYHHAFSLCPDQNSIPHKTVRAVYYSTASAEDIANYRKYVEDYQHVIQLVRAASNMSQCNWAIPPLQGEDVRAKRRELLMSSFPFLISANVRVLAYDGEYRSALSESLILRRVARHIAVDPDEFFSLSVQMERVALYCIYRVLDIMPSDEKTLKLLREQLASEPPVSELFNASIKQNFEQIIGELHKKDDAFFSELRQELSEMATTEEQKNIALALTDEELIILIREPCAKFLDSFLKNLDKKASFEEHHTEIQRLLEEYWKQVKKTPSIVMLTLYGEAEMWLRLYGNIAAHAARFNATKAAVEIYLLKVKTGRLPEALPGGLPKDPLTGEDFEYKITEEGFMLSSSCKSKDVLRYDVPQYEFKILYKLGTDLLCIEHDIRRQRMARLWVSMRRRISRVWL
ncbi:MAG: hypothetical protein ACYSWO_28295 [Planctomycetota bacterium]|jgi:hypothetical protein